MNADKLIRYQQSILIRIDQMLRESKMQDITVAERLQRWKDHLLWLMPSAHEYTNRFSK